TRKLALLAHARWDNEWNSTTILRVKAGELLNLIGHNFQQRKSSIVDSKNQNPDLDLRKLALFSTHDTKLAAVLSALNVWNGRLIPYSTAIIFELHQIDSDNQILVNNQNNSTRKISDQFLVAVRYFNETKSLLDVSETSQSFKSAAYS